MDDSALYGGAVPGKKGLWHPSSEPTLCRPRADNIVAVDERLIKYHIVLGSMSGCYDIREDGYQEAFTYMHQRALPLQYTARRVQWALQLF
jgi:hypothetical protein